jgi:hypothetical protein
MGENEKKKRMVHECGHVVDIIDDGIAPHFIVDVRSGPGLHMDTCPRCFRNLINDWMDEPWRFWTAKERANLLLWEEAIEAIDLGEEEPE